MSLKELLRKRVADMHILRADRLHPLYTRLTLTTSDRSTLPIMHPGQFVNIRVPDSPGTFLRRPISINSVDREENTLTLLIRRAGDGTSRLCDMEAGQLLSIVYPLGNTFNMPESTESRILLVGGGVGVAPLLFFGTELVANGYHPEFLLGTRRAEDVLELELFKALGPVHVTTEDGSMGEHGLVTNHTVMQQTFSHIYCCGPAPMMKAVARSAKAMGAYCEVSLENMMACGLGACLCCVEQTVRGNICVCTHGPVFPTSELTWDL